MLNGEAGLFGGELTAGVFALCAFLWGALRMGERAVRPLFSLGG